jgi:AcrR family transcriptional regulator
MGVRERRSRHKTTLRREILAAANRLLVKAGYDGVTLRGVAEAIEYSPTTIYLHFADKRELLAAVCQEAVSGLAMTIVRIRQGSGPRLSILRDVLRAYVEFGLGHPEHYRLAFMQPPAPAADAAFVNTFGGRVFDSIQQAVEDGVRSGEFTTADVDATAQALWAGVHGLVALLITMEGFPFVRTKLLVGHTIDALVRGLQPPVLVAADSQAGAQPAPTRALPPPLPPGQPPQRPPSTESGPARQKPYSFMD